MSPTCFTRSGRTRTWYLIKPEFFVADETFAQTARVAVGVHHLTTPGYFSEVTSAEKPTVITLPENLDPGSLYQPISSVDLIPQPSAAASRRTDAMPAWLRTWRS